MKVTTISMEKANTIAQLQETQTQDSKMSLDEILFPNGEECVLLGLQITRSNVNSSETVILNAKNPEGRQFDLIFEGCYRFTANWSMGVSADDCIAALYNPIDHPALEEVKKVWSKLSVDLSRLKYCELDIDPTNSKICIAYLDLKILWSDD